MRRRQTDLFLTVVQPGPGSVCSKDVFIHVVEPSATASNLKVKQGETLNALILIFMSILNRQTV